MAAIVRDPGLLLGGQARVIGSWVCLERRHLTRNTGVKGGGTKDFTRLAGLIDPGPFLSIGSAITGAIHSTERIDLLGYAAVK